VTDGYGVAAVSEAAKERDREYHREYQRKKWLADPEGCRAAAREWARANREKCRETERRYAERHPEQMKAKRERRKEKISAWQKADRLADPARYRERFRDWYENNIDYNRERQREWRAANPEALQAQANRRRARKLAAPGEGVTRQQWKDVVASYLGRCVYCGEPWTEMDHVEPLSKGGAHDVLNVAPACSSCNASKNNITLVVWLARQSQARGRIRQSHN
jgi:HNH endonuclease.